MCVRLALVLIDLVLRSPREDLLLAPISNASESITTNEIGECLFIRPFARNQIGGTIIHVFPERRFRVPLGSIQRINYGTELALKISLLTLNDVVIHSDGYHKIVRLYLVGENSRQTHTADIPGTKLLKSTLFEGTSFGEGTIWSMHHLKNAHPGWVIPHATKHYESPLTGTVPKYAPQG